jgi:quinohemoprotein amine dehydrogenase
MSRSHKPLARFLLVAALSALPVMFLMVEPTVAEAPPQQAVADSEEAAGTGIAVDHAPTVTACVRCHAMDDEGRMSRISFERKTPEGWQTSVRRMVMLNGVELEPEVAREIVRYLSNSHGLAPEEARPGLFEAERRMIEHEYDNEDTTVLCVQCHSMGRVITQRRTEKEWNLLVAMHRGYYPFVDFQGGASPSGISFRRSGPSEDGDSAHPMDKAIAHLAETFPFDSDEWTAWSANRRPARLGGSWALSGYATGGGPVYGTVQITEVNPEEGQFRTETVLTNARNGNTVRRTGTAVVYTGFQWRGRSSDEVGSGDTLREVMFVERDWRSMAGRWFTGAYDEIGIDVTMQRADVPLVTGVHPVALRTGAEMEEVTIYGANLPSDLDASEIDFGPHVVVSDVVAATGDTLRVRVSVASDAALGKRDLFVRGASHAEAMAVYDRIDAVRVVPEAGMARVGGAVAPKQFVQFEAIGVSNGADGEPDTEDDLDVGVVNVAWTMEEYAATYDDDDIQFVGTLADNGLFTPNLDGPNPERSGNRNNVGDVWVVAEYDGPGAERPLRGRAHLVVTVPLYLNLANWEPGR